MPLNTAIDATDNSTSHISFHSARITYFTCVRERLCHTLDEEKKWNVGCTAGMWFGYSHSKSSSLKLRCWSEGRRGGGFRICWKRSTPSVLFKSRSSSSSLRRDGGGAGAGWGSEQTGAQEETGVVRVWRGATWQENGLLDAVYFSCVIYDNICFQLYQHLLLQPPGFKNRPQSFTGRLFERGCNKLIQH